MWTEPVTRFLEWSLAQPPDALGYASVDWTAELLRHHLATLRIHLLWLPKRSPELYPMDHLWRSPKQKVSSTRQEATIDRAVTRFLRYLERLPRRAALRKAGVLSAHFWLRAALSKLGPRPT